MARIGVGPWRRVETDPPGDNQWVEIKHIRDETGSTLAIIWWPQSSPPNIREMGGWDASQYLWRATQEQLLT